MNGWPASPSLPIRPLVIDQVAIVPGILDNDDVATVLGYVARQFHERVEPLIDPGCWGFSFRANVNEPDTLSNHSSGTAIDLNAPLHPNGVPTVRTFTPEQIGTCHLILAEVDDAVRWGGDYNSTPDAMHWEINTNAANVAAVARKIRTQQEALMPLNSADLDAISNLIDARLKEFGKQAGDLIKLDIDDNPKTPKWSLERAVRWIKK